MVFPEGVKGTVKPFAERYRLQRFGRGGFVEIALADRRADHPGRRRRLRGDLSEARREPDARAARRRAVRPDHADVPLARPARADPAAVALADRVLRADRRLRASARTRPTTAASSSTSPSRSARRSRTASTRTWSSDVRHLSNRGNRVATMATATATRRARSAGARRAFASALERDAHRGRRRRAARAGARRHPAADALRVHRHRPRPQRRRRRGRPQPQLVVRRASRPRRRSSCWRWRPRSPTLSSREREPRDRDRPRPGPLRGESRAALRYLPATRLLSAPYRRVVERDFPDLLVA